MITLQIMDIGTFMTKLLCSELFDSFQFLEGTLQNRITYTFDGHLVKDFYSQDELETEGLAGLPYLPFSMLRPTLFDLIKGKRTPGYFKFTFFLSPNDFLQLFSTVSDSFDKIHGFLLNLKFQNKELTATTGVSYQDFSLDKSPEFEWDNEIRQFFKNYAIAFTEIS
ncbi:MAG: hypothetical protein HFI37_09575 [Lachnospiraceae bacterium]|jgi:hypothetical protein|nr:hypothetical protein [Lachnospiraceae bacterium]